MSGGGIGKLFGDVLGVVGGGKDIVKNVTLAQDTAQNEVDKKQKITNATLARKKNRSVLSTGAASMDSGSVAQSAKKLLGE